MHRVTKLSVTWIFALACAAPVFPQYRTWGIGPLAGVNLSNADLGHQDSRGVTGWALGGRLEMGMNPLLSLDLDPMLVRHTAEFNPSSGLFHGRGQFNFLEVPLFLKLRLGLPSIAVNAFAGPNLTFLWDVSGRLAQDQDLTTNDAKFVSLAGDVGLGLAFAVAPFIEVTADARYSHGFTDILDHGVGDVDHWKTRDVRLVLGVLLNTGR